MTGLFDIRTPGRGLLAAAAAAAALAAFSAAAQLDESLEDAVDRSIEAQLEDELTDLLEDGVDEQVESGVTESVEEQVESGVADAVEEQVESGVVEGVEEEIESGVVEGVESQIESGIVEGVETQLESGVVEGVEQQLESGVGDALEQQPGSGVPDGVAERLGTDAAEALRERLGAAADQAGDGDGRGSGGEDDDDTDDGGAERFSAALDADGRRIQSDVWVVLVPVEHAGEIETWGFSVRERSDLQSLDRVLLRVDAPEDRNIAEAALELALDAPGTVVDFNHVYSPDDGEAAAAPAAVPAVVPGPQSRRGGAVGLIDTALDRSHEAFAAARIVQRDFVELDHRRPNGHGTAVASILLERLGDDAPLHAASVFFEDDAGNVTATTADLVQALEWLAGTAPVINMSLTGPPNGVLETAVAETSARGTLVVAAVGNNGPAGEPLYPAAYEPVVGVTAVDADNAVYRYAGRGRHVTFAAPGVEIMTAKAGGGYARRTGTSIAAPYAAAVIARAAADERGASPKGLLAALKAAAADLGDEGFDETYGFGLIGSID